MINGMNINDSIHGIIRLTEYEKKILSSPEFNRLHDVYQNSTVYLTFPCNRTKRFEHSIGCMYLCSEMLYYGFLNASLEDLRKFFSVLGEDIRNTFYEEINAEKIAKIVSCLIIDEKSDLIQCSTNNDNLNNELQGLYEQIINRVGEDLIPHNIPKEYCLLYVLIIQAVRIAALLHDIGHPPFSHIVERALYRTKKLIDGSSEKYDNRKKQKFLKIINKLNQNHEQLHEAMGERIASDILQELVTNNSGGAYDDKAKDSLFEQLLQQCVCAILAEKDNFKVLHRIVDSTVDGDRLDYVARDYRNSGINAGDLEYKRIINGLKLTYVERNESFQFLVPVKTKNTIESFLKRRFNLYKDIINHHR
ncbi:MAG: HD domain-containing protein, partial [Bacilli bacterium]|nr:HD domain-containing protein [Bacilli bacterium]